MKKIAVIILSLFAVHLVAQDLPSEEVEVLKSFEARLAESSKLKTTPLQATITQKPIQLNYQVPTRLLNIQYDPPRIRPMGLKRKRPKPTYKFFGKAGYGTPNSPYLDLMYNTGRNENYIFGANVKYHAANANSLENQRFSETGFGINGTYYLEGFGISGRLGYDSDAYHFYGYNHEDTSFTQDQVRQLFSTFHAGLDFFNSQPTQGDINYKASLDFYSLGDNYEANETGVNAKADVTKWFNDAHPLTVTIGNDYTSYDGDTVDNTNNVFYIAPNFTYHGEQFKAKIGAYLGFSEGEFVPLPDIEASYNLAGEKFVLMAGWTGDIRKNTFRSITDYNPFVNSQLRMLNTEAQHIYGGLRGLISGIEYEAKIGQKRFNNLALFLNDTTDFKRFNVHYDKVNSFNVQGAITITSIKNLELSGTLDINTFTPDSLTAAWHLPNTELNISAKYKMLEDKLALKAELFNAVGVSFLDEAQTEQTLASLFDISFGAAYQITDNFGVFLDLNNITNQKAQRWYLYPRYGFNMLVGVTAKF